MKIRHLIPSLETTLYYHPRMIKYEDAIAKSLHYAVDPIMAFNLQLVYIQYGEISSSDFPTFIALYDITIFLSLSGKKYICI